MGAVLLFLAALTNLSAAAAVPVVANGDFENPFGLADWKPGYLVGGPSDFAVKGRTTASRNGSSKYGGALKPFHDSPMHAYLSQTVSNLTVGATYAVTCWMNKPGQGDEGWYPKVHIYCETIGASASVQSAEATNSYRAFVVTNKPDARGRLEIRLHFNKSEATSGDKWFYIDAWFDDVSIALVAPPPNSAPVANPQSLVVDEDKPSPIVLTASDADGDALTYSIVSPPGHGSLSGTPPNLTYLGVTNYFGPDGFTFKANDGKVDSAFATVSLTVNAVNDPPVANPQFLTVDEDTPLPIVLSASDVEGDALIYAIVSPPEHGSLSGVPPNLTYLGATNYFGPDSFAFKANDGKADSAVATVSLTISPVNDPPVAIPQSLSVDEDAPLSIVLSAFDADGDTLTYSIASAPTHGRLSGTPPNLTYLGATNYFGPDSFSFKANDGKVDSMVATVTLTVKPVNDPPVAMGEVSPLFSLCLTNSEQLILAPDNTAATVILDGSKSSDIENDPLTFLWFESDPAKPFAEGVRATNVMAVGEHTITLVVSDGHDTGVTHLTFEVIPPGDAVGLIYVVLNGAGAPRQKQPFYVSLNAAMAAFGRGNFEAGSNVLGAFINKVRAQVAKTDPVLADQLICLAEEIIKTVEGR